MRLVRVSVPKGHGAQVAKLAFDCGIPDVSIHSTEQHKPGETVRQKEAIDIHVSTPQSRDFVEALVRAPFYDRAEFSIDVREPRSILKSSGVPAITRPVPAPLVDVAQELWQFSHVTYSFVARVLIAAGVLSYGMIQDNPLLIVAGLVFLPFMPLLLGFGFGVLDRQWKLVAQSASAFITATLLIVAAGAAVAAVAEPPMMFDQFPPLMAGVALSFAIGLAAALATVDDVGHRQLIGLAAASQMALIPAWVGISLVFGFPESPSEKLLAFGLNGVSLMLGAAAVYAALLWRAQAQQHRVASREGYKH